MTRIAIVTGASSGLGREFVKQLDAGAAGKLDEIWVVARRADRLEALRRTCDTPVRPFCLDLTDPASFDVIDGALSETPTAEVALLINNAGFGTFGPIAAQRPEHGASMAKLLMVAPVELIYRTLPYYRAGSRVINVASVAAFLPQPKLAVYSAAKRFILDLSRSLNAELGEADIHVTALCPKFMHTEFLDQPGDQAAANAMCAIGFERAEDVARSALRASNRRKDLCIPSLDMKAYYAASRILPYKAALAVERALGIL
ncbi:SDR family NAD(P)-dependent oxidoreductase [Collinsella intestinalis]|uniref:SDR family NAD(P)-dependent oxidoreductase n=1 Tax=Collinsella intestinalis TaxID=147207 RepID=UPI0022E27D6E|nr:SDR family NAD(P)-dependent oxidoreductase [Collinsella intestinalis]